MKGTKAEEENERLRKEIKRCRQCTSENLKHMRGEKM